MTNESKYLPCSGCLKIVEVPRCAMLVYCDECEDTPGAMMLREAAEYQYQLAQKTL